MAIASRPRLTLPAIDRALRSALYLRGFGLDQFRRHVDVYTPALTLAASVRRCRFASEGRLKALTSRQEITCWRSCRLPLQRLACARRQSGCFMALRFTDAALHVNLAHQSPRLSRPFDTARPPGAARS